MHVPTTTLFLLSVSALLVQANTVPTAKETKAANFIVNRSKTQEKFDLLTQVDTFIKANIFTKVTLVKNAFKVLLLPALFKILASAKNLTFVLLWGIVATHTVCKFTPLCSFSMNLPNINKEELKDQIVNMTRPYMSEETLEYTLRAARLTMDTYTSVQDYV